MTTDITIFAQPQPVPSYLQTSAVAKALAEQLEGGLAGNQINRISLRNGKFRFLKQGVEIAAVTGPLPVIIIAANPTVGRLWWEKGFENDQAGTRPDCYSRNGVKPETDSPKLQSVQCATCPQNVKGSAKNGQGKACAYKKRTIVVSHANIMGDAYALDAGSMTMFGDENKTTRRFNLKSYIEALKANGLIVPAVVTELNFDDDATVPKLHFTPVRVLTEAEFRQVESRVNDPAVRDMLDDIDLKSEEGVPLTPNVTVPVATQAAAQAAAPAAQPTPTAPAAQPAPARSRGRPPRTETAPAAAPAPTAAPAGFPPPAAAAPAGFPPANGGAAPAMAAAPAVPAGVAGFSVDLDAFDA